MGKPSRERSLSDKEARAVARNLRVSPQKLNLVAGLIRGKKVDQALADLEFSRKRIAQDVRKCVMSAVANAENNHDLDVNALVVSEAYVGKNLVMKRFAARGRGRGFQIKKPFAQITVVVRETEEEAEKPKAKTKGKDAGKKGKSGAQPRKAAAKPAGEAEAAAAQKEAE
jgi:large subunit ribosomal protein L22